MMRSKQKNKDTINSLVVQGKLPLAFYNAAIVDVSSGGANLSKKKIYIPKYKQSGIPRANSNKCISKIYDLF